MQIKKNEHYLLRTLAFVTALTSTSGLMAQTPPDAGDLLREVEPVKPLENNVVPDMPIKVEPPTELKGVSLPVEKFQFNGNSIVSDDELQAIARAWIGKKLTLAELKHVTDLIAEFYREKGFLVRVYLPEQNINDGSVVIEIIEARFGSVILEGDTDRLNRNPELITGIFQHRQQSGEFFNLLDIERASLLTNDIPGISAKTILAASEKEGHTDLKVSVDGSERQSSYVSYDNYGSRSSGDHRIIYATALNSPFQRGDQISGNGMISEGNLYARIGYDLPIRVDGIRVGASLSLLKYELGGAFDALNAEGDATTISLTSSYPLIRQVRQNVRLTGNLFLRDYQNEQLGVETSDKSVTALNFGVRGDRLDGYKGGGVFYYGASLTLGDLDLSGNQTNLLLDQFSAQTNGSYNKVDWNVARLQTINKTTNLWVSLNGQFVNKNVDSSETMSLGGMNGVRAYPALEASGDEGYLLVVELRHIIRKNWVIKGFIDVGHITQKATLSEASASHSLEGYGVSVDWTYPEEQLTARITLANRIGDNPLRDPTTGDDSDGTKDLYPIWLNVTKHF